MTESDDRHVSPGRLPPPALAQTRVEEAHEMFRTVSDGSLSSTYPALATADPGLLGLSVATTTGDIISAGDALAPFTIMSVASSSAVASSAGNAVSSVWRN